MTVWKAMADRNPDFFIHSGDAIYADNPIEAIQQQNDGRMYRNGTAPAKSPKPSTNSAATTSTISPRPTICNSTPLSPNSSWRATGPRYAVFRPPAAATTQESSEWKMSLCAPDGESARDDDIGGIHVEDLAGLERIACADRAEHFRLDIERAQLSHRPEPRQRILGARAVIARRRRRERGKRRSKPCRGWRSRRSAGRRCAPACRPAHPDRRTASRG